MPKFSQKYPVVLEKLILLFLLFLVTAAILDIRPDPILQLWDPVALSCSFMLYLTIICVMVLEKKLFEVA